MNPISIFAEYGAVGVVILLFAGQIVFLQKTLMGKLNEIEEICIKLIDRWNRSDETRDRRHEDMMKEVDDLSDSVAYLKGRINGRAS
jgi:cell division protein FtsL